MAWEDPDDEGWKMPRSWQEVRERWQGDTLLRLLIGLAVIAALGALFTVYNLSR
jgi:hypothetical protein